MLFARSYVGVFIVAVFTSACAEDANYTVAWRFANEAPVGFSARTCGKAGIESFEGVETASPSGDVHTFRAVCGAGQLRRALPPGTWQVTLRGVDASGRIPVNADGSAIVVGTSAPFVLDLNDPEPVVEVAVAPASCNDGVDNNGNKLVDGNDPVCVGNPSGEVAK